MQDRFIRLSVSLARLQKVIQRIKTSGMGRIALKAGHTLVLCQLAAAPEGWHFSDLTERCDLDPAMISRVLADLVRSGLVEKVRCARQVQRAVSVDRRGPRPRRPCDRRGA